MDIKEFVDTCRRISRTLGRYDRPMVWSCPPEYFDEVVVYKDHKVRILADATLPSLEIEMLDPHHNPVVLINRDGECYRSHGEWRMLEDHIKELVGEVP